MTVAAALTAAGITTFRQTRDGAARGLFCGMGVCQDCLVEIDGRPNQRACMTRIARPARRAQPSASRLGSRRVGMAPPRRPPLRMSRCWWSAEVRAASPPPPSPPRPARRWCWSTSGRPWVGSTSSSRSRRSLPDDPQFAGGRRLIERARAAGCAVRRGGGLDRVAAAAGGRSRPRGRPHLPAAAAWSSPPAPSSARCRCRAGRCPAS